MYWRRFTIARRMPTCFHAIIWNIEFILRIVRNLRQLLPDVRIGLGGPQVAYQGSAILDAEPAVDFVITGEGEETVCQLLGLLKHDEPLQSCPGLVYAPERASDLYDRTCNPCLWIRWPLHIRIWIRCSTALSTMKVCGAALFHAVTALPPLSMACANAPCRWYLRI